MSTGCQHRLYIPWTPSQQCPVITRISCPLSSQLWPAGKTSRQKSSGSLESRRRKRYLLSQCMHVNLFAPEHFAEKRVLKLVKPCFLFFGGPITICCSFLHVPKVGFVLPIFSLWDINVTLGLLPSRGHVIWRDSVSVWVQCQGSRDHNRTIMALVGL